jgi:hypothetical protein
MERFIHVIFADSSVGVCPDLSLQYLQFLGVEFIEHTLEMYMYYGTQQFLLKDSTVYG